MTEIHLSEDDKASIEERVEGGHRGNADEVVAAGLRLPGSQEGKHLELQRLIQEGLDDVAAGRVHGYASAEDMLRDIKQMSAQKTGTRYKDTQARLVFTSLSGSV